MFFANPMTTLVVALCGAVAFMFYVIRKMQSDHLEFKNQVIDVFKNMDSRFKSFVPSKPEPVPVVEHEPEPEIETKKEEYTPFESTSTPFKMS